MSHRIRHSLEEETKISFVQDLTTALFDTITDSIHYLIKTRSCAALWAADLDWIVGPEYSLGGYIFGDSQLLRRRSL